MSDNTEERTYYVRTICMYMDLTKDTLLKLFKYLIKSDDITRFLTSNDTASTLLDLFKGDILNKTEINLLRSSWPNPEKFDIALLIRLIIGLCKTAVVEPQLGWKNRPHPKDESLGADLIRLRDVRNKLIGHRADAKLSKAEYEKIWDKVEAILLRVIGKVEPESKNDFVTTLNGYKQYELDTEHKKVKRYLDQLIEYQHEIEKLQNKVEELSKKSQEFHVYFETTQGHYVQYIKLLFDGGHLVLCGVFERELKKCSQGLESLFCENREILQSRVDEEYQSYLFPLVPNQINHTSWDVDLLASVILLVFTDISEDDISNIEKIKHARLNYAEDALRCLDQDKFRDIWTDLIISLKDLSMNIDKEKKLQVESFIALYKKKSGGGDADEYLDQLRKRGVPVKTLKNIHSETVYQLRQLLRQLNERGIKFKTEHVLELKILTTCQNEEKKKHAEDFLEEHLEASLHGSDQPNKFIGIETNKFFASITTHPDVTPTGIKRGCIILSFASSTPGGLLHLLDYFDSQHFNERLHNISNELHYLYEDAFLLQGYVTLENLSSTHAVGSEENNSKNGLSLPLKCSSVEGLRHVLTTLKSDQTTNRLNSIADKISAELKETVTITVLPDLLSFKDVFEKTDSEAKVSRGNYEDEADDRYSEQENRNVDTVKESLEQLSISSVSPDSTFVGEDASVLLRDSEATVSRGNYEDEAVDRYSEQEIQSADTITGSFEQLSISSVSPESTSVDEDASVLLRANLKPTLQKDKEQSTESTPKDIERHRLFRFHVLRENNIKETAQILYELQNRVGKIKNEIVTTANEVSSLYVDKTSVPVGSVKSQHQKCITESILIEDKRNQPYSEDHEKHDTSKEMSPSLLYEINESTCASLKQTLKEMKSIVLRLTDCVSTWKDNFKLVYVGLADYKEIDELASRCSRIGRYIHDLHHEILPLLFDIHVECGWATKELDIYEHKLDSLFNDFTKSTFLVTEQDSCFIRMDGRKHLPVLTVRILAAENLPPHFDKIEAMLLSESDINDSFDGNDDMKQFSMKAKERRLPLTSNQICFTPTRQASFRKLKIKNKYPPEEFTSGEQEYKVKYRTVFTTTLADRPYWTLSLPMTMLHDSVPGQEFLASTSIMWQCWGVDVFKLPLQSDAELPWTKVEELLQAKFLKLHPLTPLSDGNILYLKEMLFGTTDVPDSRIVSFEEFCINETESTSSTQTFWKWVIDAYNVIEKYLLDFWQNGLILGFISKEEAELRLKYYFTLKHGTFILRFSDHHLPNNGNVQNAYGQLNAYVLTTTEENVAISYLASSVYRKLGEYLNRTDSKAAEPRWVFLIMHSDLSKIDQRQLENATKPGVIFLDELEKLLYKIPDLADMLREHGMHDGLDILRSSEVNDESVLALSEYVFRKIGRALEELHDVQVPGGQPEPCWDYIINNDNRLDITRKDQRNIRKSLNPGEKFLEIFDICKHTLTDLKILCKTYKMQGILDILASNRQEGYLQKTLVDVHIGGERELREQKLLDILKENRSPDGCQMFRYLYPGLYTLDELCGKYT
ncbi:uncharacterized protein LOC128548770 [Mercenaria mercenaria]|uniref:uncharacterized protein LOC128548770 n=1 Tax=Mercenaria mercenaria TaxID=6596 RepID=UPI00234EDDDF|nr:uncharacterized protein LOC128548770 [Mercenaria mercenaria]